MSAPVISIEYDWDSETYALVATSFLRTEPAGPRLYRGGDFPDIRFSHTDQTSAKQDCDLLQEYVTAAWSGKPPRAKGREEKEEKPAPSLMDFKNAVWMI